MGVTSTLKRGIITIFLSLSKIGHGREPKKHHEVVLAVPPMLRCGNGLSTPRELRLIYLKKVCKEARALSNGGLVHQ